MKFLVVFALAFLVDVCWAYYVRAIADGDRLTAVFYAMLLPLLGGIVTVSFVEDHWLMVPAIFGAGLGTWVVVRKKS